MGGLLNAQELVRRRLVYRGTVQGVGFRPAVYRCATALGLTGFVRNDRSAVTVELQGTSAATGGFGEALAAALPPAAHVASAEAAELPPLPGEVGFRIVESVADAFSLPPIPPDLAVCLDCARELLDPTDRRYLYPFISCTRCGPRYTITRDTPFDRNRTSMAAFPLCPECRREYEDPADRRFHAQTTACPRCGPRLRLLDVAGREVEGEALPRAIAALAGGAVVALLGLGGFHLAADPLDRAAVARLRRDKRRERRPFAVMVRDLDVARALCDLGPEEEELLAGPASPIVIAPERPDRPRPLPGASDTGTLGIVLPTTPLHLLLFRHPAGARYDSLIMTSGNLRDEPIITDPADALRRLAGVADLFLVHDRLVACRADDTVLRIVRDRPGRLRGGVCLIRRSRGAVPEAIRLAAVVAEPTLAAGGDLKSAPGIAAGRDAVVGAHVGDLDSLPAFDAFVAEVAAMLDRAAVRPTRVVHDLHPGYRSTAWARALPWGRKVAVQHHHAHLLSVMAEHGLDRALGLAFDGTGYGPDGTVWGGEFLLATRAGFQRLGCFAPFALPGGDAAVLRPLRVAFALLAPRFPREAASLPLAPEERALLPEMLDRRVASPLTSSVGRIFDAAAAVLGVVREVSWEGEGPIRLEGLAAAAAASGSPADRSTDAEADELVPLEGAGERFCLDVAPLVARLARAEAGAGPTAAAGPALLFHRAMARAALRGALEMRSRTGMDTIAVSGGVFQNALLRSLLVPALEERGFRVFANTRVPPGDGGIALGQLWFDDRFAGTTPAATIAS